MMTRLFSTISAFIGIILIVFKIFGTYSKVNVHINLFWIGLLLIAISVFMIIINKIREDRKIKNIIDNYKNQHSRQKEIISKKKTPFKGWDMNNSPFHERKSGLTWNGGNIRGATASREKRKSFLR